MKQTRMRMAASTHWALTNGIVVYSTEKTEDKTSGETENGLAMAVGGWRSLWKSFAKKYSIASPNIMKMNKMKCQDEVGVYFYISLFASQLINENTFYRAWCNIWHHSRAIGRNKQYNKCLNGSKSMLMTSSDPRGINGRCGKQAALWVQRSHRLKDCKGGGALQSWVNLVRAVQCVNWRMVGWLSAPHLQHFMPVWSVGYSAAVRPIKSQLFKPSPMAQHMLPEISHPCSANWAS